MEGGEAPSSIAIKDTATETALSSTVSSTETSATVNLSEDLSFNTSYRIDVSTAVKDRVGNPFDSEDSITFSTINVFPVPDSGQTTDYTATFGEDPDYAIHSMSFTDNGDNTITDNVTGLTWMDEDTLGTGTLAAADTSCDILNQGGHTDWRLPTYRELFDLIDHDSTMPDTAYFTIGFTGSYWTSTPDPGDLNRHFTIAFNTAISQNTLKTFLAPTLLCVRGDTTP